MQDLQALVRHGRVDNSLRHFLGHAAVPDLLLYLVFHVAQLVIAEHLAHIHVLRGVGGLVYHYLVERGFLVSDDVVIALQPDIGDAHISADLGIAHFDLVVRVRLGVQVAGIEGDVVAHFRLGLRVEAGLVERRAGIDEGVFGHGDGAVVIFAVLVREGGDREDLRHVQDVLRLHALV